MHRVRAPSRMQHQGFLLLAFLTLLALTSAEKGPLKKCPTGWSWGPCTPTKNDCGPGYREGACGSLIQSIGCRIPCNWKKQFGADCKYKFEKWGPCDPALGTKTGQGTLKKALYNAKCKEIVHVTKPCGRKKAKA